MNGHLSLIVVSCIWLWQFPLLSQDRDVQFRRFSTRQGLSSQIVFAVAQDHQGYLWFGTSIGLNRYDGYQFRVFEKDLKDTASISDGWISSIVVGRTGDLWIGTQNGGLNRFDRATETFTAYVHDSHNPASLTDNEVASLCEDADGTLWIGTHNGGLCWKKSSEDFIRHAKSDSLRPSVLTQAAISAIVEDSYGDLWIGTSQGLCRLNKTEKETGRCLEYDRGRFHPHLTEHTAAVKTVYVDSRGVLFVGVAGGGLYIYDREKDEFRAWTFGENSTRFSRIAASCILEDRLGRHWIGTQDNGLFLIDGENNTIQQFRYGINDETSIGSNTVFSLLEDNAGALWIGTYQGISNYDNKQKPFLTYSCKSDDPRSLSPGYVMDVCEDAEGGLWLATHGSGLNYLPRGSRRFIRFTHNPYDPASLSTDMLLCMTRIRDNIIWIGSRGGGLMKFNTQTKKVKRFFHDPDNSSSLGENTIFYIYQDRKGYVWIGTAQEGLDRLDPTGETIAHYKNKPGDSTSLSGNSIWAIFEDSKGYIWVGTQRSGLNRLDPRTGKCDRYANRVDDPGSIRSNSIYAIHEYPPGILWIGTAGGGLNRFDEKTNTFVAFTRTEGLSDDHVGSILHDVRGRLWLATKSLTMFDPQTGIATNFDERDGIRCGDLNQEAASVGRDGRMYFGGNEGYVVFHPDSIYDNRFIPPVAITNFKVFEKSRKLPVDYASGIVLSYEENYFSFEFAALSFTASEKNAYKYKLEGFDNNWITAGTRRYAAYAHVDPGDYVFRVQGSNNDGVWNTKGVSVALHIIPPYWKTSWFRLSIFSVIAFAVVYILHRRFEFLKRRTREQQELSQRLLESQESERKRIGASLHDSLGQDLLVIKNLAILGIDAGRKKRSAHDQLNEISALASQVLAEVREISYDLRPYHLDQLGLTGALRSIFSRVSSSSQIVFSEDLDDVNNLFPKEQEINIFRIVQEAVNNIIKHSRATAAAVRMRRNGDSVLITVSDNGIGFDTDRQGFGLTGMAERVRILDGSMTVKSAAGKGTTISVTIPLKVEDGS